MAATIGRSVEHGHLLQISDAARRSGLYILGSPGYGKTQLLINILLADIEAGHGVLFIDPHRDAIEQILDRLPSCRPLSDIILLNPAHETHTFGINVLRCNPDSITERNDAYARAYGIFERIWRDDMGPWLQLILSNTIPVFIENQGYTLADVPLFLQDKSFRQHLLKNVRHNTQLLSFWTGAFSASRDTDQQAKVDAALTRLYILLTKEYVRHVISQSSSTLDFAAAMRERKVILLDIPSFLPEDDKKFLGTIIISELLHATRNRQHLPESERKHFCVFVDEFQNFATSRDFGTLITEGRKFGIATTIAHQERFGQLSDDKKIQGATAVVGNKVIFAATPSDARELAAEFARPSPTELRRERALVISEDPVGDLLRGHANPEIREFVNSYIRVIHEKREDLKSKIEYGRLRRLDEMDEAAAYRLEDQALIAKGALYEKRMVPLSHAERHAAKGRTHTEQMLDAYERGEGLRLAVRSLNHFLTAIMHGEQAPGRESFSDFLLERVKDMPGLPASHRRVLSSYIQLKYGDPSKDRVLPFELLDNCGLFKPEVDQLRIWLEAKMRWLNLKNEMHYSLNASYAVVLPDSYRGAEGVEAYPTESKTYSIYNRIDDKYTWVNDCLSGKYAADHIYAEVGLRHFTFSPYAIYIHLLFMLIYEPLRQAFVPYTTFEYLNRFPDHKETFPDMEEIANRYFSRRPEWEKDSVFAGLDMTTRIRDFIIRHGRKAFYIALRMDELLRNYPDRASSHRRFDVAEIEDKWEFCLIRVKPTEVIKEMPDTLSRNSLSDAERQTLLAECERLLFGNPVKAVIDELARFCALLAKPENHILHQGTQWTFKEYPTRSAADMNAEMAQELTNLPKYTAYAKVHQERGAEQEVAKLRIETIYRPELEGPRPLLQIVAYEPKLLE